MQYWQSVLTEVQQKNNHDHLFFFTNRGRLSEMNEVLLSDDMPVFSVQKRDLRNYFLGSRYPGVYFTKREAESMFWLMHGLTIAQAAAQLNLSPRTVEFYVKNMKNKLGCASKKRLIEKVYQTDLLDQLKADGMQVVKH